MRRYYLASLTGLGYCSGLMIAVLKYVAKTLHTLRDWEMVLGALFAGMNPLHRIKMRCYYLATLTGLNCGLFSNVLISTSKCYSGR